jgi:hypothetical protein
MSAKWFQPVVKIGSEDTYEQVLVPIDGSFPDMETVLAADDPALAFFDSISKLPEEKLNAAEAQWTRHQRPERLRFVAEFTAESSGDLFLYVNDAVNIFWIGGGYGPFYRNNRGTALVWLQRKPLPEKPPEPPAR